MYLLLCAFALFLAGQTIYWMQRRWATALSRNNLALIVALSILTVAFAIETWSAIGAWPAFGSMQLSSLSLILPSSRC